MKIEEALQGVSSLFLDSPPVIYYVEANPQYLPIVGPIFDRLDRGELEGVGSPVTLAECLVLPMRLGRVELQQRFIGLIDNHASIKVLSIDLNVARVAAEVRARHNLQLPDALQVAAALSFGCDALLTNDAEFRRVSELRILVLDDLEL